MTRLRILIKMESADAFELKAQALNKHPRISSAGISALKFTGDKKYIADGEFSPDLPPPAAPATDSAKPKPDSTIGERLRIVLRMASQDAFELKTQALNDDPRLKEAGIAALKFVSDKKFISGGEFSSDLPPPTAPAMDSTKTEPDLAIGERLRVVLRMASKDAFELKAQALNNDHHLKDAGIAALKFVGDKQYISGGEFSPDLPLQTTPTAEVPSPIPDSLAGKKVRVVLRGNRQHVYKLVAMHLNNDPALMKVGISGVELAKGGGVSVAAKEAPAPLRKKKRSFARYLVAALIVAVIGVTGAGALFFSGPPPAQPPTATIAAIIPVAGRPTATETSVPATETRVPPTVTKVASTKTRLAVVTNTKSPTPTALSCLPPSEVMVTAENLSCRYGPGAPYLYRAGLVQGDVVDVLGRADTAYSTWIYVQTRWEEPVKCWVNSGPRFVEISQGEVACLEPYYPEKAPLIIFDTSPYPPDRFPPPSSVGASRSGDIVYIQWEGTDLLPGDRPENSPPYLVETWTCQGGEIVFSPQGWDEPFASVQDEAGCAEPSYGYVYLAHVDGYVGPSLIPWPE
jgi:hypothetical protein